MKIHPKYLLLPLLAIIFFAKQIHAQEQLSLRDKAKLKYDSYDYAQAIPMYLKLVDVKTPKMADIEKLAYSYYELNDYEAAENWFSRLVTFPESRPENLLAYGAVLKSNLRYKEAKTVFESYANKTGDRKKVANDILGCDSAQVWLAKPTFHLIKNETLVNTALSEFSVFPFTNKVFYTGEPDSNLFKAISGRTGNPYLRVYTADKATNGTLSYPMIDTSVYNDARYHIGPIISNKAGNMLFISRTYVGKKDSEIEIAGKRKFRTNNIELYIYTANNGKWNMKAFPYNNVKEYSLGQACLSRDEQTLYFTSDMPGSIGGTDIWYCNLQEDGSWTKPENAGRSINTTGNEMFPEMGADDMLYYSSNGLPGMGGLDIFATKGSKSTWTYPINLRYPINSAADDFSFVNIALPAANIGTGYLSSNRKGGKGGDDIYSFGIEKPKIILALKGITFDKNTGTLLPLTNVTLMAGDRRVVGKQLTADSAKYFFELDKNTDYTVLGQKVRYYSDSARVTTVGIEKSDTLEVNLYLKPLFIVGTKIEIKNIHYNFDKDNIRPDAAKILDETVRIMRDNPTLEIEMGSHTDSRGSDIYNINLSQRRAQSAVNYLVSRGIARSRMKAKGYGETQLLNKCKNGVACSIPEHQENRRTEFKIVKY
ncbi:OmpA family protein [Pedobacter mendelii]|uniref:Cell envelope biogenesis protein OmpA n=1 Tax=Pedobacter mendelii TaxID=1908240 RepID=A0ABQ2BLE1_9SPHI|nr:OmpA family protein [Pedobacter mendelii]GGI28673.1 cell envelope biogenesis protein OmpA [Pedobacter mendelii]